MKRTTILYRIFTGLFAFLMLGASIPDIISAPFAVEGMAQLGYPVYFVPFIGVAKLLGVIAILIPGYPRIKEWAYAGLVFDLIGATYSIIAVGKPTSDWLPWRSRYYWRLVPIFSTTSNAKLPRFLVPAVYRKPHKPFLSCTNTYANPLYILQS